MGQHNYQLVQEFFDNQPANNSENVIASYTLPESYHNFNSYKALALHVAIVCV